MLYWICVIADYVSEEMMPDGVYTCKLFSKHPKQIGLCTGRVRDMEPGKLYSITGPNESQVFIAARDMPDGSRKAGPVYDGVDMTLETAVIEMPPVARIESEPGTIKLAPSAMEVIEFIQINASARTVTFHLDNDDC